LICNPPITKPGGSCEHNCDLVRKLAVNSGASAKILRLTWPPSKLNCSSEVCHSTFFSHHFSCNISISRTLFPCKRHTFFGNVHRGVLHPSRKGMVKRGIEKKGKGTMNIETLAIHADHSVDALTGAIMPPIHLSTTFERA